MNILKMLALVLILVSSTAQAEPPIYTTSLLDAIAESESYKKEILVIFTAPWCKYCGVLKNDLDNNSKLLEDKVVCYVDYDQNPDLVKEYKVRIIPDCFILKNRIEIKRKVGYINLRDFEKWLQKNE